MTDTEVVHLDAAMVRALAHPLRARLLALLRVDGPSNATRLAKRIGTNSGATSYHLRQLAEVGLVKEDSERGTGRERWWRSAHRGHSWVDTEHQDDPETRAAADWLVRYGHRQHNRRMEDWLDARAEWPREWRDAADQSDFLLTVTAEQLDELNHRVQDLMEDYRTIGDDVEEAERVMVVYYSFPLEAVDL